MKNKIAIDTLHGDAIVTDNGIFSFSHIEKMTEELASKLTPRATLLINANAVCDVYVGILLHQNHDVSPIFVRDEKYLNDKFYQHNTIEFVLNYGQLSNTSIKHNNATPFIGLMTSGTSGEPKIVQRTLKSLTDKMPLIEDAVWGCAYQMGTFSAILTVLSAFIKGQKLVYVYGQPVDKIVAQLVSNHVTHVSATPSFWRGVSQYLSGHSTPLSLKSITIGGETVDQNLLDSLRKNFPHCTIMHIYGSSETGALVIVKDDKAGFPAQWLDTERNGIVLQIRDGNLWVKSNRGMMGYSHINNVFDEHGFFNTEDAVTIEKGRVYFLGRGKGIINVGGTKISAEQVEETINACPYVQDCLVYGIKNPIVGYILGVEIVGAEQDKIKQYLQQNLNGVYSPRIIDFVAKIQYNKAGKKIRK